MWGSSVWEVIISTQFRLLDPLPWLFLAPSTLPWPWNLWWLLPTRTGRGLRSPEPAHCPPSGPEPSCPLLLLPVLFHMPVSVSETIWANPSVDLGLPRHKMCTWNELRVSFRGWGTCSGFPYSPQWKSLGVHGFQVFQRAIQRSLKPQICSSWTPGIPNPSHLRRMNICPQYTHLLPTEGDRRAWDVFPTHQPSHRPLALRYRVWLWEQAPLPTCFHPLSPTLWYHGQGYPSSVKNPQEWWPIRGESLMSQEEGT